MHDDIKGWLAMPADYTLGLSLLKKHAPHKVVLLQVLGSGDTFYNRGRLLQELTDLSPTPTVLASHTQRAAPASTSTLKKAVDTPVKYGRLKKEDYPQQLWPAFTRQNELYKAVNHLHSQLELLHEIDQGRCTDACQAIVSHWREINAIYRVLDYWVENKVILSNKYQPKAEIEITDRAAMVRRINSLRVRISQNKKKVGKEPELAAWRKEIEELKVLIDGDAV
jgi:hypothetical protein